jgi:hypothetical protein
MRAIKKIRIGSRQIIILLLVLTLGLAFVCLYVQNYSITEIEADTYEKLLAASNENVLKAAVDKVFQEDSHVILTKGVVSASGFEITYEKNRHDQPIVTLRNKEKNVEYHVLWRDNEPRSADAEYVAVGTANYDFSIQLRMAISNLMVRQGFVLRKTSLINGHDIIVKELDNAFIIGLLISKFDDESGLMAVHFNAYKKRKYLKLF